MPRPLSDQVVVVTGASSGIGRATATGLARRGAEVAYAARGRDALTSLVVDPALVKRLLTAGGLLFRLQQDLRADDRVDNLEVPAAGLGRVSGTWQGWVRGSSAYTDLVGQRPVVRAALAAGTVGLLARRLSHKSS